MKKFRELLISGINENIQGSNIERLCKVKEIFEYEMIYNKMEPTKEILTQWLQGLPHAIYIPYMNDDIILWYETQLKRKAKESKRDYNCATETDRWLDRYWPQLGQTLYEMLYK